MRRFFRQKTSWVFVLAVLASLAVHLPAYEVLGVLAKVFDVRQPLPPEVATVEFNIEDAPPPPDLPDSPLVDEPDPTPTHSPNDVSARPTPPRPVAPPPAATPEPEAPEPEVAPAAALPPPPQAETRNPQAIQQRSADPTAPPPPDARFIARENSQVDEEVQARLRSLTQDAQETSPGRPHHGEETEEPGNADEQQSAETHDREGSDARRPTPEETQEARPEHVPPSPPPDAVAAGDGRTEQPAREAEQQARPATPASTEERSVQLDDGFGSFTVRLPRVTRHATSEVQGSDRARAARRRGEGRGRGEQGPDLRVAWSQFENIAGHEQLDRDREAYLAERRSRQRGSSHQARWREFRAAMENYVPGVRMGNQTALNAAASPFAEYIAAVHRRIHPQYAEHFLAGLPTFSDNPFADRTLMTKLEIILERDGRVHRIGIVRSSGFLPFDYGAFAAVMRAQPFPEAPTSILSGDGRVYLRWGFYRNERQCGTFNAEPYILPNPPGTPRSTPGGLRDTAPANGGVIPSGASPTWGTQGERERESGEGAPSGDDAPGDAPAPAAPEHGAPPPERPAPVELPPGAALG